MVRLETSNEIYFPLVTLVFGGGEERVLNRPFVTKDALVVIGSYHEICCLDVACDKGAFYVGSRVHIKH